MFLCVASLKKRLNMRQTPVNKGFLWCQGIELLLLSWSRMSRNVSRKRHADLCNALFAGLYAFWQRFTKPQPLVCPCRGRGIPRLPVLRGGGTPATLAHGYGLHLQGNPHCKRLTAWHVGLPETVVGGFIPSACCLPDPKGNLAAGGADTSRGARNCQK